MGRKTTIAIVAGVLVLVVGVIGAYAYDNSQKGKIADGVTIAGVDVGGLNAAEAKRRVRRELLTPLRHSLRVGYDGQSWELPRKKLKVHAAIDRAVEDALNASDDGGLPGRLVRYVSGGEVDKQVSAEVTYSKPAVNRFVRQVATAVDREPQDATVEATGDSVSVAPAVYGRKLRDNLLTDQLNAAVLNAGGNRTIVAHTHSVKPELVGDEVASAYPSYLTLDRS